jgi:antitoxin (DNA-binding transcriptional repressor) of toxin-antitoxin stability system
VVSTRYDVVTLEELVARKAIGIRALKARLSEYIRDVKDGHTIVVTECGRAVAHIAAVPESSGARTWALIESGFADWSGKRLRPMRPVARIRPGAKSLARIVSENRD